VLISDFGECELLDEDVVRRRTGATGTMEFMAPELLMQDVKGLYLNDFDPAADLWSLGVLLYYLCYASLPWSQVEDIDLLRRDVIGMQNLTFPDETEWKAWRHLDPEPDVPRVSMELKRLMRRLICPNPRLRPTADEILKLHDEAAGDAVMLSRAPSMEFVKPWTAFDIVGALCMVYVVISLLFRLLQLLV